MAGCFDFRQRTSSFDLHVLATSNRLAKFGKLFRSKSDTMVKQAESSSSQTQRRSPKASPKSSPSQAPRRRFMRVVRDAESVGEEYSNPHIIRKYKPGFWEENFNLQKSQSLEDTNKPLPYTVNGPTILKKQGSTDSETGGCSQSRRHASFKEEVEVVEFDRKGKCVYILDESDIVKIKLHDSDEDTCSEISSIEGDDCSSDRENDPFSSFCDVTKIRVETLPIESPLEVIEETHHESVESPTDPKGGMASCCNPEINGDMFSGYRNDSFEEEVSAPKISKLDSEKSQENDIVFYVEGTKETVDFPEVITVQKETSPQLKSES